MGDHGDHHHHHGHNDHDHHHGGDQGDGPSGTDFLDLEMRKVLLGEAQGVTREAFRDLLKEAAKRHLQDKWGDRIDALAGLAVDELLADVETNMAIEAAIEARAKAKRDVDERLGAVFGDEDDGDDD